MNKDCQKHFLIFTKMGYFEVKKETSPAIVKFEHRKLKKILCGSVGTNMYAGFEPIICHTVGRRVNSLCHTDLECGGQKRF